MSDEQKVIYKQMQLAGLGLVLMGAGFLLNHSEVVWVGVFVLVLGIVRTILIKMLLKEK